VLRLKNEFFSRDPAVARHRDIPGLLKHDGKTDTSADWISMRMPDVEDWIEYRCNVQNPTAKTRSIIM
jgi:hypothetical protein